MKSSDDLFQLIGTLSRSEKGYFKKYTTRHVIGEGNNYIRLFDAISSQQEYDQDELKKMFEGETFIKHLPSEKHYLYQLLLRALSEYHAGATADMQLRELMQVTGILYEKGLYRQCLKTVDKARRIAERFGKPLFLLQVEEWESRLLIALADLEGLDAHIRSSALRQKEWLEQYENTAGYRRLEEKIFYLSKTIGFPRNRKDREKYERILRHPLLRSEKAATSYRAKFHFYNIHNFYYEVLGRTRDTYRWRSKLIHFIEAHPEQATDDLQRYVIALNNLLNSQDELGLDDEFKDTLARMRSLPTKSINIRARIFAYTYNLEFTQHIIRGEFRKIIAGAPAVIEGMQNYRRQLHPEFRTAFRYQFFCGYFGAGEFAKALKWMNELLNDDTLRVRREIYFFARIMNLVLHYELGNTDLLAYNIRNTYRFFMKQQRLFRFESVMLDFIRRSAKFHTGPEMRQGFASLKAQLEALMNDPYERSVLSFFDIISWLESKMERKTFAEIVRRKIKS